MSRARRIAGATVLGCFHLALMLGAGLYLTPFFLRTVGTTEYGQWLIAVQVVAYASLLDLGLSSVLARETGYLVGKGGGKASRPELTRVFGQGLRLSLWQTPLVAVTALASLALALHGLASVGVAILVVATALAFPLRILAPMLRGLQDLLFLGWLAIAGWAVSTAVTVALAWRGFGLTGLAVGWAAGQLLPLMALWLRLRARLGPIDGQPLSWDVGRRYLGSGLWTAMSSVGYNLAASSDVIIAGALLGPRAVVAYVCTTKLAVVLANFAPVLLEVSAPALAELRTAGTGLPRALRALTGAMLILSGGIACVVVAVNHVFVPWWVGPQHYAGPIVVTLMLASMLFRHASASAAFVLYALGDERRLALTLLMDGALTVIVSLLAARHWGLVGLPLGNLVGCCVVSLPANWHGVARRQPSSTAALLAAQWPWAWRFALVFAASAALSGWPHDLPSLIMTASVVTAGYAAVMTLMVMRSPLAPYFRGLWAARPRLAGAPSS